MDQLLSAVRQAAGDGYTVYGELGREHDADVWYLARDLAAGSLVAMRLYTEQIGPSGRREYALEVARELNASVSVGMSDCPACGTPMRRWGRFCTRCGASLADGDQSDVPAERERQLAHIREEAGDVYDVLGEMPWSGGGAVFFALERSSGRLVRLRVTSGDRLAETKALMPFSARVTAGYMTSMMPGLPPPPTGPLFAAASPPETPPPVPRITGAVPPPAAVPGRSAAAPPALSIPVPPPHARAPARTTPADAIPAVPVPDRAVVAGATVWAAPLSAREWLLLAVIAVLVLVVLSR